MPILAQLAPLAEGLDLSDSDDRAALRTHVAHLHRTLDRRGYVNMAHKDVSSDPMTAVWRDLPAGANGPKRSDLAREYRARLGDDWRNYYEGPYEDDGPSQHESSE